MISFNPSTCNNHYACLGCPNMSRFRVEVSGSLDVKYEINGARVEVSSSLDMKFEINVGQVGV